MKLSCMRFIGLLLLCVLAGAAQAQSAYQSRPIHIVVANPPGGQTDVVTRIISERLGALLGQPIIIENRPGGNTNNGTKYAAQQPPDGYTLVVTAINNFGANPALIKNMPFDPVKDFRAIVHTISSTKDRKSVV